MGTRLMRLRALLARHPHAVVLAQVLMLAGFFAIIGWAIRGDLHDAGDRLRTASAPLFLIGCAVLAVYYLVFVLGWMWLLRAWDIHLPYGAALRAEMVSMLAKYIPGGVWTPAARVVAARRAGVTDGGLVTASMLVEAGLSAISGVLVFVISLTWVHVHSTIWPVVAFGIVLAVLLHPRIFHPVASRILRRFGTELRPLPTGRLLGLLVYYAFTWLVGGAALYFLLRSVGGDPGLAAIPFLGGVSAVGAIVAVLVIFAPSGLGAREGAMGVLLVAATSVAGAPAAAVVLNRVAITVVEIALLLFGAFAFRLRDQVRGFDGDLEGETG